MPRERRRTTTAWAVKAGRDLRGLSREELAQQLAERTGSRWTHLMVRELENGGKVIPADLVPVLGQVLDLPLEFLLYGPRSSAGSVTNRYAAARRNPVGARLLAAAAVA